MYWKSILAFVMEFFVFKYYHRSCLLALQQETMVSEQFVAVKVEMVLPNSDFVALLIVWYIKMSAVCRMLLPSRKDFPVLFICSVINVYLPNIINYWEIHFITFNFNDVF